MWAQQVLQQESTEVRRILSAVDFADCLAFHNSSSDHQRAVVQMGGMLLGVQLDDYAGFSMQFGCTQRDESVVPVLLKVPILVSTQGTQVSFR